MSAIDTAQLLTLLTQALQPQTQAVEPEPQTQAVEPEPPAKVIRPPKGDNDFRAGKIISIGDSADGDAIIIRMELEGIEGTPVSYLNLNDTVITGGKWAVEPNSGVHPNTNYDRSGDIMRTWGYDIGRIGKKAVPATKHAPAIEATPDIPGMSGAALNARVQELVGKPCRAKVTVDRLRRSGMAVMFCSYGDGEARLHDEESPDPYEKRRKRATEAADAAAAK